jgi:hypothetical protein
MGTAVTGSPAPEILTRRQVNRATLARQMLLEREETSAAAAVERLCGMQAQEPKPPFVGLWSRVAGFRRKDLHQALLEREVVRATLMRGTLHLFSASDYVALRQTIQPVLTRARQGILAARKAEHLELDRVLETARELLAERPRTFGELRPLLVDVFPNVNDRALGYATRTELPLVMVPTESRWSFPANADFALAEQWLGRPLATEDATRTLVLRYLAAFGPATAMDAQTWSGLSGLQPVLDGLRPQLRVFRDERGREVFDLPAAPRPAADTPAAPRFLPEFDNLLLSHADRTRVLAEEHRALVYLSKNLRVRATFLLDGVVSGTWRVERKRKAATLQLTPFAPLAKRDATALEEEGERMLHFLEEDATTFDIEQKAPIAAA